MSCVWSWFALLNDIQGWAGVCRGLCRQTTHPQVWFEGAAVLTWCVPPEVPQAWCANEAKRILYETFVTCLWRKSGCVCKRICGLTMSANISCRYEFVQASLESKKRENVESHKGKCCYWGNRDDLKSFVLLGEKIRKITQEPHSTISIPSSAYFHLIFKWVLFYIQWSYRLRCFDIRLKCAMHKG